MYLSNGETRAAQKELNKLKDHLRRRLIPELEELEKEISRKGIDTIIEDHPSLENIIMGIESIKDEVSVCMNK